MLEPELESRNCTTCEHPWHGLPCDHSTCHCKGPWWDRPEGWRNRGTS